MCHRYMDVGVLSSEHPHNTSPYTHSSFFFSFVLVLSLPFGVTVGETSDQAETRALVSGLPVYLVRWWTGRLHSCGLWEARVHPRTHPSPT